MRKFSIYALAALGMFFYACSDDDEQNVEDLEAPVFSEVLRPRGAGAEGVVEIRGEYMEPRSETSNHFHVEGTVTDNNGLSELKMDVHGVFDGHSHGRSNLLPAFDSEAVLDMGGATTFSFKEDDFERSAYYYDEQNFRAGPYDVILHAVDLAGNSTSFADGSSVARHIYLRRPYQPTIVIAADPNEEVDELDFAPGDQLFIDGWIQQNRGEGQLAFEVTFIKITISEDDHDDHAHRKLDENYEAAWGTSHYLTAASGAPLAGREMPAFTNDQLDFRTLIADQPYTLSEADDHMVFRVEIEDAGGNIAIREFELEVHN